MEPCCILKRVSDPRTASIRIYQGEECVLNRLISIMLILLKD
jgi:hypothetical protein